MADAEIGDWWIADKRGQGTAHKIGEIHRTPAQVAHEQMLADDPSGVTARLMGWYDYRHWDSLCGQVNLAPLMYSVRADDDCGCCTVCLSGTTGEPG